MNTYSVLLQRPELDFGDTYLAHVYANTVKEAVAAAQKEVADIDDCEDVTPEDYYPLITVHGWVEDLTPRD